MSNLRKEILKEAGERFQSHGYGQDDLLDIVFELLDKRLIQWQEWAKQKPTDKLPEELDPEHYKAFNDGFNEAIRLIRRFDLNPHYNVKS